MLSGQNFDRLNDMLKAQHKLDIAIYSEHDCEYNLEKTRLALIDEFGEMNHENKASWCWWKYTQAPVDRKKLLEELVDAWHFAMSIENHENKQTIWCQADIQKYMSMHLSILICWAVLKVENIMPIMYCITKKLGFTFDDVYRVYFKKNEENFRRLESGY